MKNIISTFPVLALSLGLAGCFDTNESAQKDFDYSHALAIHRYKEALETVQTGTHRILECMGNHNERRNTRSEGIHIRFLEDIKKKGEVVQVNGYTHSPRREVNFHELKHLTWSIEKPMNTFPIPSDPMIPTGKFCKEVEWKDL